MAEYFDLKHNAPQLAAALAKEPGKVLTELDRALGRGAIEVADAEKRAAPKFKSELTNSIAALRAQSAGIEYHVFAAAKHGVYVDGGSGPGGAIPLEEAKAWLRLKKITPRDPKMSPDDLAKLIRLKVLRKGVTAQPFWAKTFDEKRDRLVQLANDAVARALGGTA